MKNFRTLDDVNLENKVVLLRADLNVPMNGQTVTDETRLKRLLPTLEVLSQSKTVILSHLGRPDGRVNPKFSLKPVAEQLSKILEKPVQFANDCKGPIALNAVRNLKQGDILVLENTRFYPEEEENDPLFAKDIAQLGDIFVNDAFSAAHRAHASTEGLAHVLPAYAGRLMQEELSALERALEKPQHPLAAIVGGSKISTKLELLENLISKVDYLILGGGMANTFLAAQGKPIGASLYEKEMLETARLIIKAAEKNKCKIILPLDACVALACREGEESKIVDIKNIENDQMILDLGPETINEISTKLGLCKTIVWNGPLGVFEIKPFDEATNTVAKIVASLTKDGKILSVAGGGDTVSALSQAGTIDQFSYVSTAGGAFLEWLEGKTLPGVQALFVNKD